MHRSETGATKRQIMTGVVMLCAVLGTCAPVGADAVGDLLAEVAPGVEVGERPAAGDALSAVRQLQSWAGGLDGVDGPGWMLGLTRGVQRAEVVQQCERLFEQAARAVALTDGALGGEAPDADPAVLDQLVLARVAVVPLRLARACLALAAVERDPAAARLWAERGRAIAEESEGVSAWTRAERAVLLGQAHVLLGDGVGALRVIRGAQESLRDATRAQRMEALFALVRGTEQAAGIAEAEGVWHRIVERPPFVEGGRVDAGAKAMAIGVLTRARLEASESVAERRRVRREASDMLARLLAETDEQSGAVFHQLGRLRDPGIALADEPMPVLVGQLFGDFRNREVLEALCDVDVRTAPAGEARKKVMLAAVTFLYGSWNDALRACAVEHALTLLEQHAADERVGQLTGLLMPMARVLATEDRLARARAIEEKLPAGAVKGQLRMAIAYAMVEAWDGTGEPPDIDAVLAELYEDALREQGAEFRRAFWKRVLVWEEDRVAAGGEITSLGAEAAVKLRRAVQNVDEALLDRAQAEHVLACQVGLTPVDTPSTELGTHEPGVDSTALATLDHTEALALRARLSLFVISDEAKLMNSLVLRDEKAAKRTWRVMMLFDSACVREPALHQFVALDRDVVSFRKMPLSTFLLIAKWGVEEQEYELTPGMRRVLLRCSASARDAELARWLAETIGERVRSSEERLLLGEAWLTAGEDERAFGVYRQLALDLEADDPRAYEYWAAYARMLEILERKNEMGTRSVEMRREIDRLRALPGYDLFEDARWAIDRVARSVDR
ncbi:MAG: hypothetical protein EA380_09750, partial [Phycisphaeraceae bacterium]